MQTSSPLKVTALEDYTIIAIDSGGEFSCALSDAGELYCFGSNFYGQLGSGSLGGQQSSPFKVTLLAAHFITAFSCGWGHVCALTNNDQVYCYGRNDYGQLGGASTASPAPGDMRINSLDQVTLVKVSAGAFHTCVLSNIGRVYWYATPYIH